MKTKAFSLIELLVALSILAVVAAIIVPKFLNVRSQAAITTAMDQQKTLQNAVSNFMALGGTLPAGVLTRNIGSLVTLLTQTTRPSSVTTTAGGTVTDSTGSFGSSTISLSMTPVGTGPAGNAAYIAHNPGALAAAGFYYTPSDNSAQVWYSDGAGDAWWVALHPPTGDVTFYPFTGNSSAGAIMMGTFHD